VSTETGSSVGLSKHADHDQRKAWVAVASLPVALVLAMFVGEGPADLVPERFGLGPGAVQQHHVGSTRGAVPAFPLIRFLGPPSEPAVRVSTQRALHKPRIGSLSIRHDALAHGVGIAAPR
jgi:hypothetical protein